MNVTKLRLRNFRNHARLELLLKPGLTVFTGGNGQGKTNILESVYLCSAGKSHRASRDAELVKTGAIAAYVMVCGESGEIGKTGQAGQTGKVIEMSIDASGAKRVKLNSQPVKRISDILGHIIAVMVSPDDLRLVKGAPGDRRRFIDLSLCRLNAAYCRALTDYQRALLQKNALLKRISMGFAKETELLLWDEALAKNGAEVVAVRAAFCADLRERIRRFGEYLSEGADELGAVYQTNAVADDKALLKLLTDNRQEDIRRGQTQTGAHHDELSLLINGAAIKEFGSQGQQRSAMIALKLAESELIAQKTQTPPVLLLDDVLSELDERRRELLLRAVEPYQTLLTCTEYAKPFAGEKYLTAPSSALHVTP